MKLPKDTSKYYPSQEDQIQLLFRNNNPKLFEIKNRIRDNWQLNADLCPHKYKEILAKALYSEMFIFHRIKIPTDRRAYTELADALYRCLRPDQEEALGIFYPDISTKKVQLKKYYDYIYESTHSAPTH